MFSMICIIRAIYHIGSAMIIPDNYDEESDKN